MPEVTLQVAQQPPKTYIKVGHSARVSAINEVQSNLNAWLTHWSSATPAVKVLAPNAGDDNMHLTKVINDTINTMNAAAAEFSLVPTGSRMKNYLSIDYNGFVSVMNMITAQMTTMTTGKP